MLDGEAQRRIAPTEVEIAVAPGVEISRSAQRLAVEGARGVLTQMMYQEHGELVLTLKGAEVAEQRGHLGGGVFVGLVEADQRVEDQKPRPFCIESPSQSRAIACGIEPQRGGEDEADVERAKIQAARGGDSVEALADEQSTVSNSSVR